MIKTVQNFYQLKRTRILSRLLCVFILFLTICSANAATRNSVTSGNLNAAATWGGTAPVNGDILIVNSGHTVTVSATFSQANTSIIVKSGGVLTGSSNIANLLDLTIENGGLSNCSGNITLGALNISGSMDFTNVASRALSVANFVINNGGVYTGNNTFTISGTVTISGSITFNTTAARTDVFSGDITLNNGGSWVDVGTFARTQTFSGSFTNNATTFNVTNTGVHTFSGTAKSISGSTITSFPNIGITGTPIIDSGATVTVTTTLTGTGTLFNLGTLNIGGTSTITGLTATAAGNTINYTGTAQTVKTTSYTNLILSGSGVKTIGIAANSVLATGNLSIAPTGSATASITNTNVSVDSLTLGGLGKVNGTWGSTTATAATNKNNTYFAGTGYLSVTNDTRLTPVINTVPTATAITYGETLASSTLTGGTTSVAGSFTFTTPATAPNAGTSSQDVTFIPTDLTNYKTTTTNISVAVNKVTPTVSVAPAAALITYGQTLASSVLSGGTSSVAGTFAFTTPSRVPDAGTASQEVTFTPTDTANYNTVATTASVVVNQASQTITFGALAEKAVGDIFVLTATSATSGINPVTYMSSNTGVATVSGNTITVIGVGSTNITASQASSANYNAASDVIQALNITASATWNGTVWSNTTGPTALVEAVIDGTFGTTVNGVFTAKKLTVTSSGALTINSGTNLTVQNELINNAGTGAFIIQNNANLIQVNNTTNTGEITVNRDSNELYRLDYTIWSSPVSGTQRLYDFSPLTATNRFNVYDPITNAYVVVSNGGPFVLGNAYLIRMPNEDPSDRGLTTGYYLGTAPITYHGVFTGTPNNGDVSLTGLTAEAYNAIGNPYPSAIDADSFLSNNVTKGTLYFFRKRNGATGESYATYTLAGGVGTSAATSSSVPNGTIQAGQGFLVELGVSATTLNFTNAMRVANNDNQFFKTKKKVEKNRIWLNLTNTSGDFSQTLVGYITGATQGVDTGIDGKSFNDPKVSLTSNINNEEYTIQGRSLPFDPSDVVPLNFKTDKAGDYTIAIDHTDGLFATGQDVYLVDSETGTETDLKVGSYIFTAPAGTANSRFSLKYQKTLGVDASVFNENGVTVYKNKAGLYVNSGVVTIANVKVYDIQGKLLVELKDVNATSATISNLKNTQQVLVVKVTAQDNTVVTKKVFN